MRIIYLFILLFFTIKLFSQTTKSDSLWITYKQTKTDTAKVRLLINLAGEKFDDSLKFRKYITMALTLAEKNNFIKGKAMCLKTEGKFFTRKGKYDKAYNLFLQALTLYDEKKYPEEVGNLYEDIGNCCSDLEQINEAITYYNKALVIYKKLKNKSGIATILYDLGYMYHNLGNYGLAVNYYHQSLKLYEECGNKPGLASIFNVFGNLYFDWNKFQTALEYYNKCLNIQSELKNYNGIANAYTNIGNVYDKQEKIDLALEYFNNSRKIYKDLHDFKGEAIILNNIGYMNTRKGDNNKALQYYNESLQLAEKIQYKELISFLLGNIGGIYIDKRDFQMALKCFSKSLNIAKTLQIRKTIMDNYEAFSKTYHAMGNYKKAYEFHILFSAEKDSMFNEEGMKQVQELKTKYETEKKDKELKLQKAILSKQNEELKRTNFQQNAFITGFILILLLTVYILRNYLIKKKINKLLMFKNAEIEQQKEEILTQSEKLSEINKELEKLSIVASETDNSIVIFDAHGKPEWVNAGFTRLNGYTLEEFIKEKGDNLFKMSSVREISSLVSSVITEKKVVNYTCMITSKSYRKIWIQTTLSPVIDTNGNVIKLIAIDSDITKIIEAEEEIKKQKEKISAQRDEIELHRDKLYLSNEELTLKNKQIIDSITYAQLIQEALLPDIKTIQKHFTDSFIFFKPRNIVSGDFYWFHEEDSKLFFVVADCTGHGVPGAFMSMIGTTLLNEIVKNKKIQSPSQILAILNKEINIVLKQQDEVPKSQGDGMDITFFVYYITQKKLIISMANQTIILIDKKNVTLLKGDIYSVGGIFGSLKQTSFTDHEIYISDTSKLYLFTDGIKDQFNDMDEKFGEERLKKHFVESSELPMEQQKDLLLQTFNSWKGEVTQIDDILVAGIKLI